MAAARSRMLVAAGVVFGAALVGFGVRLLSAPVSVGPVPSASAASTAAPVLRDEVSSPAPTPSPPAPPRVVVPDAAPSPISSLAFNPEGHAPVLAAGRVRDAHGRPVPGARVALRRRSATPARALAAPERPVAPELFAAGDAPADHHAAEPPARSTECVAPEEDPAVAAVAVADHEGRFLLRYDAAPDEAFFARAETECCRSSAPLAVVAGEELDLRVDCAASLAVRVSLGGRVLGPDVVRVRVVDAACVGRTAYDAGAGRAGLFRADGLAPGPAVVEVYAHGGSEPVARLVDVALVEGRPAADPRLDPWELDAEAQAIRVRVVDADGRPVAHAAVRKITERALDLGGEPACRARLASPGALGADDVRTDAHGIASLVVRRRGDALAVSCDGFVSARLADVREDVAVRLRRYRTIDVGWAEPPPELAEVAADSATAIDAWWDVLLTFEPDDGGPGWSTVLRGAETRRLYCEQSGVLRGEYRLHAGLPGLPFDFVETLAWNESVVVQDLEARQTGRLRPPSAFDVAAALPRLADRVSGFTAAWAERAEAASR